MVIMHIVIADCAEQADGGLVLIILSRRSVRKTLQRVQQLKEIAGSNQQLLGEGCNPQITEVMLEDLPVFCN